jgi:hypothetical protein
MITQRKTIRSRPGSAYLMTMVLLAILAVISVVMVGSADLNVQKSANSRSVLNASLVSESGLGYLIYQLETLRLPGTTTQSTFAVNLQAALAAKIGNDANLHGQTIAAGSTSVTVPSIPTDGGSFTSVISWLDDTHARLNVTGLANGVTRGIQMDLDIMPKSAGVFDYGLASKGQITVHGSARIVGVNTPGEASVLSATQTHTDAIHIDGNTTVSGDLYAAGENSIVVVTGSPTIAGSNNPQVYASHIHFGAAVPDFPEVNTAPIAALAVNVVDHNTNIGNKTTFNNIVIKANTNPTFTSSVTLNGVVYIEAPNNVRFEGGATLNGLVVTQQTTEPLAQCQIYFGGHVEARGVDVLPATSEFAAVKQQTGTFIAAPGFGVTFAGSFSTINGSVAADQLTFAGTADGTIRGTVIGLKDLPTDVGGNVDIFVDRNNADPNPAGFIKAKTLAPNPSTYAEKKGSGS